MAVWIVRAGSNGEAEEANLAEGVVTIDWARTGDLTPYDSRESIAAMIDREYSTDSEAARRNHTSQIWRFRSEIENGDLIIMPLKTRRGSLAFGRCTGDYAFASDAPDSFRRHRRPVEWREEFIPRSAIRQDLLYTINGSLTVFEASRNSAAARLEYAFANGTDPGQLAVVDGANSPPSRPLRLVEDEPPTQPTVDLIHDRIRTHLAENFTGHHLTRLVADILTALGFVCSVSPEGPDGGVDILAGKGPFGLDSPTLVVEVKSEPTPVGTTVLRGLHSAMTQYQADQALLVAMGGITRAAHREFATRRTSIHTWDGQALLTHLLDTYPQLPQETQRAIPLVRTWVLSNPED